MCLSGPAIVPAHAVAVAVIQPGSEARSKSEQEQRAGSATQRRSPGCVRKSQTDGRAVAYESSDRGDSSHFMATTRGCYDTVSGGMRDRHVSLRSHFVVAVDCVDHERGSSSDHGTAVCGRNGQAGRDVRLGSEGRRPPAFASSRSNRRAFAASYHRLRRLPHRCPCTRRPAPTLYRLPRRGRYTPRGG